MCVLFVVQQLALLHWFVCCCVELWSQLFPFGNLFMEIFISIGERLKEEREAMGKTQSDFAEIAAAAGVPGATRQSQAKYEKGLSSPSAAYLSAIALRGVDVHYVLTGERSSAQPARDAAEQVLLDSYRRCGAQARQNLIQTAALLAAGLPGSAGGGGKQVNTASGAVQILGSKNRVTNKRT